MQRLIQRRDGPAGQFPVDVGLHQRPPWTLGCDLLVHPGVNRFDHGHTRTYRPAGPGSGTAYLGCTPRLYFEQEDVSTSADAGCEAAVLALRLQQLLGVTADEGAQVTATRRLPRHDLDSRELDVNDEDEDEDLDDADVFVEIKTGHFLIALGLPMPNDLPTGPRGLSENPAFGCHKYFQ